MSEDVVETSEIKGIRKRIEDMLCQNQFDTPAEILLAKMLVEVTREYETIMQVPEGLTGSINTCLNEEEKKITRIISKKYLPRLVQSVIQQYKNHRRESNVS